MEVRAVQTPQIPKFLLQWSKYSNSGVVTALIVPFCWAGELGC